MKGTYTLRNRTSVGLPPMCQGCPYFTDCGKKQMACAQFEHWSSVGGRAWSKFEREPSTEIYNRIFNQRNAA